MNLDIKKGEGLAYASEVLKVLKAKYRKARIVFGYDISCKLPSFLKKHNFPIPEVLFTPSMHAMVHVQSCQLTTSPSRLMGIGVEDGEDTERFWSLIGKIVYFLKII